MRAIIVDDEELAVEELENSLAAIAPHISVVGVAHSVAQAVELIPQTPHDLIFMDISLGDGKSFDIFKKIEVLSPVIFITAYDSYSLQAFKNQGIDYILKPFSHKELSDSIDKLKLLQSNDSVAEAPIQPLQQRFMVTVASRIKSIKAEEVAYFMADGKYLYLYAVDGGVYIIDSTITAIAPRLSTSRFFQINRKFIISFDAINEMYRHSHNRVKITLNPPPKTSEDIVVSTDRVVAFRRWLNM
ncbi:MAG: LytTR family DNA-binding domain-containing protein [Rikenellaceae bacterium]